MRKMWVIVFLSIRLFGDHVVWSSPEIISTIGQNASEARIVVSPSGDTVAAWIENGVVMAKSGRLHGMWESDPVPVSEAGASSLGVVMDLSGKTTAIWNLSGVIQAASLPLNGSWSSPISLSSSGGFSPQIAVDGLGNVAAIWVCNGIIQASIQWAGEEWPMVPDDLTSAPTVADCPQIDIDKRGVAAAVWHQVVNQVDAIYTASRTFLGAWNTPIMISDLSYPSVNPRIAINPKTGIAAAWFRYKRSGTNYSRVIVQTSFLGSNGVWAAPTDISKAGFWNPNDLALQLRYNGIGIPILMWNNSYDRVNFDVESSVYIQEAWLEGFSLVSRNRYAYDLDFTISSAGYAFASYMMQDPVLEIPVIETVISNTYGALVNFGDKKTITFTGASGYPRIAGTTEALTKDVGAVWLYFDGMNNVVQSAWGAGSIPTPPSNLSVVKHVQDWGVFEEYYNTLTWEYSSPEPYAGFLIFCNNVMVGSVPSGVLTFTDWNRNGNGALVYGVAVLEMDGDQSPTATINVP